MRVNEIENIKDKLRPIFEANPQVGFVYIFGSRVKGQAGPKSDYDFSVYLTEPDTARRHDIVFSISARIMKALGSDNIDIHSLNDIQAPELKYQIIRDGKVIFEREPHRAIVEPRILSEYFDFTYLLKKYNLTKA